VASVTGRAITLTWNKPKWLDTAIGEGTGAGQGPGRRWAGGGQWHDGVHGPAWHRGFCADPLPLQTLTRWPTWCKCKCWARCSGWCWWPVCRTPPTQCTGWPRVPSTSSASSPPPPRPTASHPHRWGPCSSWTGVRGAAGRGRVAVVEGSLSPVG